MLAGQINAGEVWQISSIVLPHHIKFSHRLQLRNQRMPWFPLGLFKHTWGLVFLTLGWFSTLLASQAPLSLHSDGGPCRCRPKVTCHLSMIRGPPATDKLQRQQNDPFSSVVVAKKTKIKRGKSGFCNWLPLKSSGNLDDIKAPLAPCTLYSQLQ